MSAVARRYAKALYDLAKEQNAIDRTQRELLAVADAWDTSPELRGVFENPAFSPDARKKVVVAIAQRVAASPMIVNALSMLADRNRMRNVREIAEAFVVRVEAASGRVQAEVVSAGALPDAYYVELAAVLKQAVGRDVTITKKIDASIIGGVVTRVGDTVFDGSITHRLAGLKSDLLDVARSGMGEPHNRRAEDRAH
jgi:F-type H+-transporting ATPase subunit delta